MHNYVLLSMAGVKVTVALNLGAPYMYISQARILFVDSSLSLPALCDACEDVLAQAIEESLTSPRGVNHPYSE